MKNLFPLQITKRIYIYMTLIIIIPTIIMAILIPLNFLDEEKKERERELLAVAAQLEQRLELSFAEILKEHGALDKSADEHVAVLNSELQPIVNQVSSLHPDVGLGYYCREIDRVLAIGPIFDESMLVEFPENYPYFKSYETGKPEIAYSKSSIGWYGAPIINLTYPIYNNGDIVGHTWANVRLKDLYLGAFARGIRIIFIGTILLAIILTMSWTILSRLKGELEGFAQAVVENKRDLQEGAFPELKPILNTVRKKEEKIIEESLERKRVEEELNYFFSNSTDFMCIVDFQGYFKRINPSFKKILGYTEEELMTVPSIDFVHPEDKNKTIEILNEFILQKKVPSLFRNRFRCKDGSYRWLSWTGVLIPGKKIFYALARDVTELIRMEGELLKASKLESVGILAGGLAHDFNNLLTVISGNTSLAQIRTTGNEKVLNNLSEIEKAVDQAQDLTQQLLTFSKGGMPVKTVESLGILLRETTSLILSGSNIKCDYQIADFLYYAEIDKGQISQVINNLVINAIQAMPGGGTIKVSGENFILAEDSKKGLPLKPGNYIKISIADSGCGISKENLAKIFDPYYSTKQSGNGLGLATAYSIIKKHNGYIAIESEMDVGTTATIYLPASGKEELKKIQEAVKPTTGKGKILLMDDEEAIRGVLQEMLQQLGHETEVAKDGNETIKLYCLAKEENTPFDLVIMDLTIPGGMGGKEAINKLQALDPEVRAIVSSGYSNDPVMAQFRDYGFKGVVKKPYEIEELSRVVGEILGESQKNTA